MSTYSKLYLNICLPNQAARQKPDQLIYKCLLAHKLISIPPENLHISNYSTINQCKFCLYDITGDTRKPFGALEQIHQIKIKKSKPIFVDDAFLKAIKPLRSYRIPLDNIDWGGVTVQQLNRQPTPAVPVAPAVQPAIQDNPVRRLDRFIEDDWMDPDVDF